MKKVLKDPLLHFLVLGLCLFIVFDFVASDDAAYDRRVIDVDREALLTFMQYQARAFEPGRAAEQLNNMSDVELDQLIGDYVREEALHREAIALGIDKNDYIIKRRMIQSIEFITDGFVTAAVDVTDADVVAYYQVNHDDYYVNPFATFTHIFINGQRHDREKAYAVANAKLKELNDGGVQFSDAPRHGDRFPYFVNYVERDPQFVASHFGPVMAEKIFQLDPGEMRWRGPFESEYGLHLVLLAKKVEGRYPELTEVERAVRDDAEREAIAAQKEQAIRAIVDTYEVRRTFERPLAGQAQK